LSSGYAKELQFVMDGCDWRCERLAWCKVGIQGSSSGRVVLGMLNGEYEAGKLDVCGLDKSFSNLASPSVSCRRISVIMLAQRDKRRNW